MKHQFDDDACCIHCGHDGAEESHLRGLGYEVDRVDCPVWDEATRAENLRRRPLHDPLDISEREMLDAECPDEEVDYGAH